MPGMALKQFRRTVEQERHQDTAAFGEAERMLEGGLLGGGGVAERVVGGRFQQPGMSHPAARGGPVSPNPLPAIASTGDTCPVEPPERDRQTRQERA